MLLPVLLFAVLPVSAVFMAGHSAVWNRLRTPKFTVSLMLAALLPVAVGLRIYNIEPVELSPLILAGLLAAARWIYANRQIIGAYLVWAGVLSNWLVLALNNGMPVATTHTSRTPYKPQSGEVILSFLGDNIPVYIGGNYYLASIGDLLILTGNLLLILQFAWLIATHQRSPQAY